MYTNGSEIEKQRAAAELLNSIEPFIRDYIKRYNSFMTPDNYEDFLQCARMGVLKSLSKYDPKYSLTTFAPFCIKNEIQKYICDMRSMSCHFSQRLNKIKNVTEQLEAAGLQNPTARDIADVMGISEKMVMEALQLKETSLLEYYETEEQCSALFNVFAESPESILSKKEDEEIFYRALMKLSELERNCLLHKFGGFGIDKLKIKDISVKYGITILQVREITAKAISKLKHDKELSAVNHNRSRKIHKMLNSNPTPIFADIEITSLCAECDQYIESEGLTEMELK